MFVIIFWVIPFALVGLLFAFYKGGWQEGASILKILHLVSDINIQNQNFINPYYGPINSGKNIQEQFPVRSEFNGTKTLPPKGYEFVANFHTDYMQETGKVPDSPFVGYTEAFEDPNNYIIDPSNLRV